MSLFKLDNKVVWWWKMEISIVESGRRCWPYMNPARAHVSNRKWDLGISKHSQKRETSEIIPQILTA